MQKFAPNFLLFSAFLHKKRWKWLFQPVFGVPSTQMLVKIYNNWVILPLTQPQVTNQQKKAFTRSGPKLKYYKSHSYKLKHKITHIVFIRFFLNFTNVFLIWICLSSKNKEMYLILCDWVVSSQTLCLCRTPKVGT